ncbi:MAG: hypothetical protein IJX47_06560 [Clostridia bacterium]|nr:hypothetical protein [Clostridia bacterium]
MNSDEKIFMQRVTDVVLKNNYKIKEFYIDSKCFGNIVLVISNGIETHHFYTDRGEIIFNNKPVRYMLSFDERAIDIDFSYLPSLNTKFLFLTTLIKFFEYDTANQ